MAVHSVENESPVIYGIERPGALAAIILSLAVARDQAFPESRREGSVRLEITVFASQDVHILVREAAQVCGIGTKAVHCLPVDHHGRLDAAGFEQALTDDHDNSRHPLFVAVGEYTGSADAVALAMVCRLRRIWLHIHHAGYVSQDKMTPTSSPSYADSTSVIEPTRTLVLFQRKAAYTAALSFV
ncbi:hypothetical protein K431DRAFT_307394 [Polychaeton citri CBS 116435]|uniref:Uncharacterized protein n=1 Tax=Polychaeton citri CBS 116435 TaxID=1314669 RepID=A0A9P4Q1Z1_9PEZI|nr:hypothetical protein K431DRAFT_307394 [Polychaeton citri CBS 116435]